MSEIKLLPCPCCGSEAKIGILEKHFTFYRAVCLECGLTAKATPTPELTASLWNTRKPIDRIVEQLQQAESVKCYGSRNSGNYMIPLADAIEIVKAGGKDEA